MLRKIIKYSFLCALSAALLILSFPNFNLWALVWFGFVPLFIALENKNKLKAFILSYITGFIFWLGVIYWLIHVTFAGMIVLALYLALYFGLFGLIITSHKSPLGSARGRQVTSHKLILIPSVWVILEYIRSYLFTGFPWAPLSHSQYLNLPIIQIADITGTWGISFLIILINVWIYLILRKKQNNLFPILLLIIVLAYGYIKLYPLKEKPNGQPLRISVIQGNIPQELKWNRDARDFILNRYLRLNNEAMQDKPDLIIWPEASFPGIIEEGKYFLERVEYFAKETKTPLLIGAATTSENDLYYNSALLIDCEKGSPTQRYSKIHLVPFGEYIPLRKIFGFLETVVPIGDFAPGKDYTVFNKPAKFSVLICFEDLFPELSRRFVQNGAQFLVNITNDAWFGKSSSPYQHLSASVLRAVENHVYVLRSANTGISGFISPTGKIISLVKDKSGNNIFISGYLTENINLTTPTLTFYTKYGDLFLIACLIFIFYGIIRTQFKE